MFDTKSVSGKYIARYRILRELASSASSRIFLTKHSLPIQLPLVVKLFYIAHLNTLREETRFLEEMRPLGQLRHPFILPVMDAGIDKRVPYIAIPYLPSGSLYECMQRHTTTPFSIENTITILWQIGQALHHAHQNHIFHGNLKPHNILLHQDGYVQLSDFICKTAQSNYRTNPDSALYMAPEQFAGEVNALSDQYALGCLAYELFTSRTFFRSSFPAQRQREQLAAPTQYNPLLPAHIEQAILKATAPQPEQRHTNVLAFLNALSDPIYNTTPKQDTLDLLLTLKHPALPRSKEKQASQQVPDPQTPIPSQNNTTALIIHPLTQKKPSLRKSLFLPISSGTPA